MRLFFALDLPDDLKAALEALQARLRPTLPKGSWPPAENLHLTLAFLGEQPEAELPGLSALGAEVAARHRSFKLRTADLGAFPNGACARVLWMGLEPNPALASLALDLRHALAAAGPFDGSAPFRPHLTLARFQRPSPMEALPGLPSSAFPAGALCLFRSVPGERHPRYQVLQTHPFAG